MELLLIDLRFGALCELATLLVVTVVDVEIYRTLHLLVSQDHIAFFFLPAHIELLVLLLELDLVGEVLEVFVLVLDLLDCFVLLLLLVRLRLAFDHGAPLVQLAVSVDGVVSLVILL